MRDHTLWLPEGVHPDEARPLDFSDSMQAHVFRNQLKMVDPARLDMIRTSPQARMLDPDRYLIVYKSEGGLVSWFLIQDEDGNFCEPDERHWDRLMRYDQARSNGSLLDKFRRERDMVQAAARQWREDRSEQFRDELGAAMKHLYDSQIHISADAKDAADGKLTDAQKKQRAAKRKADRRNRKPNRKSWK